MTRFVEEAIARAGLAPVFTARRAGDLATVRSTATTWGALDLMALGAVADAVRADDVGNVVRIHEKADVRDVTWVAPPAGTSELDVLRAVAVARIVAGPGARIGVDWTRYGLELAQVALGFGASDLCGAIVRKSGLPIYEDEKKKVKGQGMVDLKAIKKLEIAALVTHAARVPVFADEETNARTDRDSTRQMHEKEAAGA